MTPEQISEIERRGEQPSIWRSEPPSEPGWYWARQFNDKPEIVEVVRSVWSGELVTPARGLGSCEDPVRCWGMNLRGERRALWGPKIEEPSP